MCDITVVNVVFRFVGVVVAVIVFFTSEITVVTAIFRRTSSRKRCACWTCSASRLYRPDRRPGRSAPQR